MQTHTNLNQTASFAASDSAIPVLGICGYSGAGKTTLIAKLLAALRQEGLQIAVIKQDAHGLDIDRPGKDTDILFRAGADVQIRDQQQFLYRSHNAPSLHETIRRLSPHYDLILVEGHKSAELSHKVWLCKPAETTPPPEATHISLTLPWDADRATILLPIIRKLLRASLAAIPLFCGILIGGKSTRMGTPKHLLPAGQQTTWLERTITTLAPSVAHCIILGAGVLPPSLQNMLRLPDIPGMAGPLAGMRAAMRWGAGAQWIFCACDMPKVTSDAISWLLAQRKPGIHAILPRLPGRPHPEPLLAWYGPQMAAALELVSRPRDLATMPGASTPEIPTALAPQWSNANTPTDMPQLHNF